MRDIVSLGDDETTVSWRKPEGLAYVEDGQEVSVEPASGEEVHDVKVRWRRAKDATTLEYRKVCEWVCGIKAGGKLRLEAEWDLRKSSHDEDFDEEPEASDSDT